jgi:hypothetical protein
MFCLTRSFDGLDGLASCLRAYLSAGFSGMSLLSSDIGGYTMQQYVKQAVGAFAGWLAGWVVGRNEPMHFVEGTTDEGA